MTRLPTDLSGQELVRILTRIGFVLQRQRGSHIILRRESPFARVSVPDHKALRVGTLRASGSRDLYRTTSCSSLSIPARPDQYSCTLGLLLPPAPFLMCWRGSSQSAFWSYRHPALPQPPTRKNSLCP